MKILPDTRVTIFDKEPSPFMSSVVKKQRRNMSGDHQHNLEDRERGFFLQRSVSLLVVISNAALIAGIIASTKYQDPQSRRSSIAYASTAVPALDRLEAKKGRALTTESFASDESFATSWNDSAILPFGPQILDGYETCDDLSQDILEFLYAAAYSEIKQQKNVNCTSPGHPVSGCHEYNFTNFYGDIMEGAICFDYYADDLYGTLKETPFAGTQRCLASTKTGSYGTNNLVNGVDENDLVKSDGDHIFVGSGSSMIVTDLDGNIIARVNLTSSYTTSSLLLHNYTLMVIANGQSPCGDTVCPDRTTVFIYKFDRESSSLDLINQVNINGFPGEARNIGSRTLIFTSNQYYSTALVQAFDRCSSDFANMTDDEYETAAFNLANKVVNITLAQSIVKRLTQGPDGENNLTCQNILKASRELRMTLFPGDVPSLFQVTSFDADQASLAGLNTSVCGLLSGMMTDPVVHVTNHSLLLAFMEQNDEHTFLISFDSIGASVTPKAVGVVKGALAGGSNGNINQLSLDYFGGYYRVATTTSGVYSPNTLDWITDPIPHTFVLQEQNSQLVTVGEVKDFVGSEAIASVHFLEDRGFVFTNDINDVEGKLQVLDISSPTNPTVISVLNGTAVAVTYPIQNGMYILTLGYSFLGLQVGMIDLSDIFRPAELPNQTIYYSEYVFYTDATWYFHSMTYADDAHKLIIPATAQNPFSNSSSEDDVNLFFVLDVDKATGIHLVGNITHPHYNWTGAFLWPPGSIALQDDLITFADNSIISTTLNTLNATNWILKLED